MNNNTNNPVQPDWDYSTPYCDGCAELGLTSCSCEPDEYEDEDICSNCGEPVWGGQDICDECEEEEYRFAHPDEE